MGRLDALEIKEFIKYSAQNPQPRLDFTTSSVSNNFGKGNPMLKELGITADCKPLQIEGRVLPQPIIKMGTKTAPISQGAWRINQYHKSVPLQNWAVLDLCSFRGNEIRTFVDALIQSARQKAFNIAPPEIIPFNTNRFGPDMVKEVLTVATQRARQAGKPLQLILCAIRQDDIYRESYLYSYAVRLLLTLFINNDGIQRPIFWESQFYCCDRV